MIRIQDILDKVASNKKDANLELIQKAYIFAAAAHAGQTRLSGEPYLSHPLEVAYLLAELKMDEASIAAGLLHDTVEDTKATIEEIDARFGEEVADVVDGVTKISLMTFESKEQAQGENIRKMILAMAEDIRVLLVKLADRLHNMRTLEFQKPHKRQRIAQETMDIYAPLANRLGIYKLQVALEDISLKYLKPDVYDQIQHEVERHQTAGKAYTEKVIEVLEEILRKEKINGRVSGRTKHAYSIYRKMVQQNLKLDEVHDLIAFRVIVDSLKDCYAVFGLVHAMWKPVPGRIKDYISMPKANMYQSLHTTVIGPEGERIEIQIRTDEMHQLAERGVASHWLYKENSRIKAKDVEQFRWLRQILDWQKVESDSKEFMRSLRFDLFKEEVYVFTPQGEVRDLPEGATPVDFAYLIHTEVGNHCAGAKVNGRLVTLDTKLQNGDTVEIITDSNRNPSRDWLKFVKSAKARTRINHYLRTVERSHSISLAKEMLEKEGRKQGVNFQKAHKAGEFEELAADFSFKTADDLFSAVGYSRITPNKVLRRLLARRAGEDEKTEPPREEQEAPKPERSRKGESVSIKGVDDVLVRFARCCNPLPGDNIIGYISRGRGVTVHTADCPNLGGLEPERLLSVEWEGEINKPLPAKINILCKNSAGVLAAVAKLLAEDNVNIDSGHFQSNVAGHTEFDLTVEVRDAAHLYRTIEHIARLKDVYEVKRTASRESS